MTNHTYIIRQQDRNIAIGFIDSQLNKNHAWLNEIESQRIIAGQEYLQARTDSVSFNAWCQKWLNESQWAEIKQAIMARNRQETRLRYVAEPHKTISVTHRAWKILSEIALQEQLTLSEVIINRLGDDDDDDAAARPPAKSRYNLPN